jgi:hypothetical protein
MIERTEPAEVSRDVLVFQGSASTAAWIVPIGVFAFSAVVLANEPSGTGGGAIVGCLLVAVMFALIASRRQIAEFDTRRRRLRIFRQSFGRWTRTLVDYPFDQCPRLGRIEYETEGHFSYGVYVELNDGSRHAIPLTSSTFVDAGHVVALLSDATGIPKLDIKF